jgi:tetratricopeptide (TPR) repeat protein
MKPVPLIAIAVLLSATVSYVLCSTATPRPAAPVVEKREAPAANEELARLALLLREVEGRQDELTRQIEGLKHDLASRANGQARVPLADIDAAVARALEARGAETAHAEQVPTTPVKAKRTAKDAYAELAAVGFNWDEAQKVWKALREDGLVDEVLALFEEKAKDQANDPAAQVELGKAYLQKLFTVPAGPEQGLWAMKADKSFDAALALDDHSWSARFNKGVSLSNWPAFMGKQNDAARQFETLIEQQNQVAPKPEHAQTYFFLGNLYQGMGKGDQALATWKKGLELFPGNAQLENQVHAAEGH